MKLILTRHSQTDYNVERKHDHLGKAMLTEHGEKRSQLLAQWLENVEIDYIFSSPLQRCVDTITPVANLKNTNIITDERISEFRFSQFQDICWNDVDEKTIQQLHDIEAEKIEGCEHMSETLARAKNFINELQEKYPTKTILICTHGGTYLQIKNIFGEDIWGENELPKNNTLEEADGYEILEI